MSASSSGAVANGGVNVLAQGFSNVGSGSTAMLTVIAHNQALFLYINGQYMTKVSDTLSRTGEIGMLAGNSTGGPTDVAFNDAQVWTL
jgi:hypothetical protein